MFSRNPYKLVKLRLALVAALTGCAAADLEASPSDEPIHLVGTTQAVRDTPALDTGLDGDGKVWVTSPGSDFFASDIKQISDGRFYLVGSDTMKLSDGSGYSMMAVGRYLQDGSIDPT